MIYIFSILAIIVLLLMVFYFLLYFKKLSFIARFSSPAWLPWTLSAILTGICVYLAYSIFSVSAIVMFFMFFSFILTDILNLFVKKCIRRDSVLKIWTKLFRSGFLAAAFTITITSVSYYTAEHVVITKYDLKTNKSFGAADLKISMISDLHLGTTMNIEKLKKYCNEIQESSPDLVVLVGDIFDERTSKENMEDASKLFGQLKSTYGVYYVFGNHDAGNYGSKSHFSSQDIITNLASNNVIVLDDEVKLINSQFYIIGRKDASFSHKAKRKTLKELLEGVDKSKFILELDHQPLDLHEASNDGIDLQLSGHTHAGQIWPGGLISNLFHINELNYGIEGIGNYEVIVSSGIGAWGYPFKLGSKAEIVQIKEHSN